MNKILHFFLSNRISKDILSYFFILQLSPQSSNLFYQILVGSCIPNILIYNFLDLSGPTSIFHRIQSLVVAKDAWRNAGYHHCLCISSQRILQETG